MRTMNATERDFLVSAANKLMGENGKHAGETLWTTSLIWYGHKQRGQNMVSQRNQWIKIPKEGEEDKRDCAETGEKT